jgi:hypothetical protein
VGLHHERQHDLSSVRPMRPVIPSGAGHDRCLGFLLAVGAPIDLYARRVEMDTAEGTPQALGRGGGPPEGRGGVCRRAAPWAHAGNMLGWMDSSGRSR